MQDLSFTAATASLLTVDGAVLTTWSRRFGYDAQECAGSYGRVIWPPELTLSDEVCLSTVYRCIHILLVPNRENNVKKCQCQ